MRELILCKFQSTIGRSTYLSLIVKSC